MAQLKTVTLKDLRRLRGDGGDNVDDPTIAEGHSGFAYAIYKYVKLLFSEIQKLGKESFLQNELEVL
jgi:hypothetical protein